MTRHRKIVRDAAEPLAPIAIGPSIPCLIPLSQIASGRLCEREAGRSSLAPVHGTLAGEGGAKGRGAPGAAVAAGELCSFHRQVDCKLRLAHGVAT